MCGITGILSNNYSLQREIKIITPEIKHRGPDQTKYYFDKSISLGINRLAINDIQNGHQPLVNEKKNVIVVYNGEIYNSKKLRQILIKNKIRLKSNSDGEVIPHLYDLYGKNVFNYLDGMFSIALWDKQKKKLFLARDSAGEKPLYYYSNREQFSFSSEIKALRKLKGFSNNLNYQAIWDLPTFLWVPEPNTIFSNIKSLNPGTVLEVENNIIKKYKIKCNFLNDYSLLKNENDFIEETQKVVRESITSRLMSDVKVGSFLSGGLDSSIVATIASEYLNKIDTYTIGFPKIKDPYGGFNDESFEALATSKKIASNHHNILIDEKTLKKKLDKFSYYYDQPTGVSSALGIFLISEVAKKNRTKVLLSGDGADECFGGYSWYKYLNKLKNKNRTIKTEITLHSVGIREEIKFKQIFNSNTKNIPYALHYYGSEMDKKKLFSQEIINQIKDSRRMFSNKKIISNPENIIKNDRQFYLRNEMLTKVDRMTMANSVESRCPFVSPNVLNLAENIPFKLMYKNNNLKWVLRKAFEKELGKKIINRKKHGFNIPIDHWLKNQWSDLVDQTFENNSSLVKNKIIKRDKLNEVRKMINYSKKLNGHMIFSLIMLNKWMNQKIKN